MCNRKTDKNAKKKKFVREIGSRAMWKCVLRFSEWRFICLVLAYCHQRYTSTQWKTIITSWAFNNTNQMPISTFTKQKTRKRAVSRFLFLFFFCFVLLFYSSWFYLKCFVPMKNLQHKKKVARLNKEKRWEKKIRMNEVKWILKCSRLQAPTHIIQLRAWKMFFNTYTQNARVFILFPIVTAIRIVFSLSFKHNNVFPPSFARESCWVSTISIKYTWHWYKQVNNNSHRITFLSFFFVLLLLLSIYSIQATMRFAAYKHSIRQTKKNKIHSSSQSKIKNL